MTFMFQELQLEPKVASFYDVGMPREEGPGQ